MQISKVDAIPVQQIAKTIGEFGCYFSSLVYIAEQESGKKIDLIRAFDKYNKKKTCGVQWVEDDCFINRPDLVLLDLLKENGVPVNSVTVRKETDVNYHPKTNEVLVGCYEWKSTMKTYSHFVNVDNGKRVVNDPIGSSNTVKNGVLRSLRVFTIS
ncbi:MAG: DUF261 domain-containing protein [Treponema sp.]|nr:DUF261 domain-containing protein [Treponema sp.]